MQQNFGNELIIDNFAGGGGASTGIEQAAGRQVDIAINHDPVAMGMHRANHPGTQHLCENVWKVNPVEVCAGRPVGLAWYSPDCTHHSRAKGGKPVKKKIRGLAWVVLRWAATVRPRVIMLENVEEFVSWGPLLKKENGNHYPCPKRKGRTFKAFINALKRHGYNVEYRALRACDYGAPTIRKRLFMVARCDSQPIVWPEPTHGDPKADEVKSGRLKPWRTAAECIDWSIPCPSIFERKKPLVEMTLRRIAKGIMRYVVNAAEPFIVTYYGDKGGEFRGQDINDPLATQTTDNRHAVVTPFVIPLTHQGAVRTNDIEKPFPTVTSANGGEMAVVNPILVKAETVSAFLAQHNGGFNQTPARSAESPLSTIMQSGSQQQLVAATLVRYMGQSVGQDVCEPARTITVKVKDSLVTSHIVKLKGTNIGQDGREPLQTITAGGLHFGEVRVFLLKYYGTGQNQQIDEPLHTVTTKDRFGIVTIKGDDYQIVDIGMRMLTPRELFRAQGFPDSYIIDFEHNGKPPSKASQVRMCGNSVSPYPAKALVEANYAAPVGCGEQKEAV